jgi:hypothetical protein
MNLGNEVLDVLRELGDRKFDFKIRYAIFTANQTTAIAS